MNSDDVIAQIGGGLWRAKSAEPLTPAALVDVLALEGLTLMDSMGASGGAKGRRTIPS